MPSKNQVVYILSRVVVDMLRLARWTLVGSIAAQQIAGLVVREVVGSAGLLQLNGTADHAHAFELAYRHFASTYDYLT